MSNNTLNILLTCVNAQVSPSFTQLIYGHPDYEIKVIGTDAVSVENNLGRSFCHKCYQVPSGTDKNYIPSIKSIVSENNIKLIFPCSDEECLSLSRISKELKRMGCDIACSSYAVVSETSNKYRLMNKLIEVGIHTSVAYAPQTISDIKLIAKKLGYPKNDIVFKPIYGRGSKGFKLITEKTNRYDSFTCAFAYKLSLDELMSIFSERQYEISKYMMMEYYPGDKYSADILVANGKVISMVIRNNGSLPKITPPTQIADIVFDEDIRKYAESIVGIFGFDYFVQIEIGRDIKGSPCLIEINTRLDAALPITTGLGLNFFHEMITYAMTGRMRENICDYRTYDRRLRFRRYWQHIFEEIHDDTF